MYISVFIKFLLVSYIRTQMNIRRFLIYHLMLSNTIELEILKVLEKSVFKADKIIEQNLFNKYESLSANRLFKLFKIRN